MMVDTACDGSITNVDETKTSQTTVLRLLDREALLVLRSDVMGIVHWALMMSFFEMPSLFLLLTGPPKNDFERVEFILVLIIWIPVLIVPFSRGLCCIERCRCCCRSCDCCRVPCGERISALSRAKREAISATCVLLLVVPFRLINLSCTGIGVVNSLLLVRDYGLHFGSRCLVVIFGLRWVTLSLNFFCFDCAALAIPFSLFIVITVLAIPPPDAQATDLEQPTETPDSDQKNPVFSVRLSSVGILSAQMLAGVLASSPWALLRVGNVHSPNATQTLSLVLTFAAAQIVGDLLGVARVVVWAAPVVQGIGVALLMLTPDSVDPNDRTTADVLTIAGGCFFVAPIPILIGAAAEGLRSVTAWKALSDEIIAQARTLRQIAYCPISCRRLCLATPEEAAGAQVSEIVRILQLMVAAWFVIFALLGLEWMSMAPLRLCFGLVPILAMASVSFGHWATSMYGSSQVSAWGPPQPSRKGALLLSIATVLITIGGLLRLTTQVSRNDQPYDGTLTVLCWNVARGMEPGLINGLTVNVHDVGEVLRSNKPNIVGLQETHVLSPLTGGRDVATLLANAWGISPADCYGSSPRNSAFTGALQFTPHSFAKCEGQNLPAGWPLPSMAMSETVVRLNSTFSVTVLNVHPILTPPDTNKEQIRFVVERAKRTQGPLLIMGDFNAIAGPDPEEELHQPDSLMQIWEIEGIRHAFNPSNDTSYQYPITRPDTKSRIDHIFYRDLPEPILAEVLVDDYYSDHLALKVTWRP
eukprot:gnl/TRDRNA2_/TRDRNA2_177772_c4_seq3.p1 gnl/TRDRNA2_/TRDRNA2_177772_c4~~gnl/TRDRNA2_/TRDRNA2_177772_c4_seq3.p1  ORF type:complete len:757 (-),score=56.54 gnl/TRDRNA2_/TRDRNA2_177772_c4_seq3:528-2798(-)